MLRPDYELMVEGGLPLKPFYTETSSAKANNGLNNTSSLQTQFLTVAVCSMAGAKGLSMPAANIQLAYLGQQHHS